MRQLKFHIPKTIILMPPHYSFEFINVSEIFVAYNLVRIQQAISLIFNVRLGMQNSHEHSLNSQMGSFELHRTDKALKYENTDSYSF